MTQAGAYYEADNKLNDMDFRVPRRPSKDSIFDGGEWVENQQCNIPAHVIKTQIQPQYFAPPPQQPAPQQKEDTGVSKDTKLTISIKEILLIGSFVVSGAVAWQDINQRIAKLESDKTLEQLSTKVSNLDAEIRAVEKNGKGDVGRLEKSIANVADDLEKYVLLKGRGAGK